MRKTFKDLVSEFDDALDGMEQRRDVASGEGRKLSTLMRDTYEWIHGELRPRVLEFMRTSGREDRAKPETQKSLEELWKDIEIASGRFDTLRALTGEAVEIVRGREREETVLEQMDELTKRLHELRESD